MAKKQPKKARPKSSNGNGSMRVIDKALQHIGKTRRWLAQSLDVREQSVCEWFQRGDLPFNRVREVNELLGIDPGDLAPVEAALFRRGWIPAQPVHIEATDGAAPPCGLRQPASDELKTHDRSKSGEGVLQDLG